MKILLKNGYFILFLLLISCSPSYGSVIPSDAPINEKEKITPELPSKPSLKKQSFQTSVPKTNFNNTNRDLHENELINRFNNKASFSLINLPVETEKVDWKSKYFALLTKRTSKTKKAPIPKIYKSPTTYNLVIILYDIVPPKKNYHSYCNIFINKRKRGQTNQALLSQKKILKLKVKTGIQHMLSVKKVFLNEKKKKWERMRNLIQPKSKYFTIPKDRIRVITIIYNSYKERADTAHLKYKYPTHFMIKDEEI